jgi:hypothetical protein
MTAGRMPPYIQAVRVSLETSGVFESPSNRAAYLVGHDTDVAVRGVDRDKIKRDVIDAGVDKKLGRKSVVLRFTGPPSATVDENENGAFGFFAGYNSNASTAVGPYANRFGEPSRARTSLLLDA